jgi:hypothetical protein
MSKKTDIKICRYRFCKHDTTEIDTSWEEYHKNGNQYYHKDCYEAKKKGEWKDKKTKSDLQLIKNLWVENISSTVNYSRLFYELNEFIARGIDSEYLVFVMKYVIENKCTLNYPAGFKWYVDDDKIKRAYGKSVNRQMTKEALENDKGTPNKSTAQEPKVIFNNKPSGFGNILGGS